MLTRRRPIYYAPTKCVRFALLESGRSPPASFARALAREDRHLELYWHPTLHRWILYRLVKRGVVPSEDILVKEFEVRGPRGEPRDLGPWVLETLRRFDKTRGGAVCPERGSRLYTMESDRKDKEFYERRKNAFRQEVEETIDEIEKVSVVARRSSSGTRPVRSASRKPMRRDAAIQNR